MRHPTDHLAPTDKSSVRTRASTIRPGACWFLIDPTFWGTAKCWWTDRRRFHTQYRSTAAAEQHVLASLVPTLDQILPERQLLLSGYRQVFPKNNVKCCSCRKKVRTVPAPLFLANAHDCDVKTWTLRTATQRRTRLIVKRQGSMQPLHVFLCGTPPLSLLSNIVQYQSTCNQTCQMRSCTALDTIKRLRWSTSWWICLCT